VNPTITPAADRVKPVRNDLVDAPYTLSQIMANFETMQGTQDLSWCHWLAGSVLERGINAMPVGLSPADHHVKAFTDWRWYNRVQPVRNTPPEPTSSWAAEAELAALRERNRKLVEALEAMWATLNQIRKHGDDYCFKYRNEPLDPCDCVICQARAALALNGGQA